MEADTVGYSLSLGAKNESKDRYYSDFPTALFCLEVVWKVEKGTSEKEINLSGKFYLENICKGCCIPE